MLHLPQVLKGVEVQAGRTDKTPHPRIPITPTILMKLREVWLHGTSFNNMMLWAVAPTIFFSFAVQAKQLSLVKRCMISRYTYPIPTSLLMIH